MECFKFMYRSKTENNTEFKQADKEYQANKGIVNKIIKNKSLKWF